MLLASLCISLSSTTSSVAGVTKSSKDSDLYKLYAHSRLVNDVQYQCLSAIIYKESRWSISASNGSHYGLGQMRSQHYRNLDGYRQIDATIKYIKVRYGSMCNGLRFHIKRGYY